MSGLLIGFARWILQNNLRGDIGDFINGLLLSFSIGLIVLSLFKAKNDSLKTSRQ